MPSCIHQTIKKCAEESEELVEITLLMLVNKYAFGSTVCVKLMTDYESCAVLKIYTPWLSKNKRMTQYAAINLASGDMI